MSFRAKCQDCATVLTQVEEPAFSRMYVRSIRMAKHILLLMLAFSSCLFAQETRREVMHPSANPTDDTKPNSTTVPETLVMNAHLERVIVLRCKYNTDLLAELNKAVAQQKIRNAVILSGVGSVRGYQLH